MIVLTPFFSCSVPALLISSLLISACHALTNHVIFSSMLFIFLFIFKLSFPSLLLWLFFSSALVLLESHFHRFIISPSTCHFPFILCPSSPKCTIISVPSVFSLPISTSNHILFVISMSSSNSIFKWTHIFLSFLFPTPPHFFVFPSSIIPSYFPLLFHPLFLWSLQHVHHTSP